MKLPINIEELLNGRAVEGERDISPNCLEWAFLSVKMVSKWTLGNSQIIRY